MQLEAIDLTQIVVALIGFVGVVVSARQKKREKGEDGKKAAGTSESTAESEKAEPPTPVTDKRGNPRISSAVMLASLVLLVSNLAVFGWRYWGSGTEVSVKYPPNNSTVEIKEMIQGTSQRISKGQEIWIVVYPHITDRYYPQNGPADVEVGGEWASLTIIGVETDTSMKFDIIAVLADETAQDTFNDYLSKSQADQSWEGLEKLPSGAAIYDRVTVTRE